MERILHPPRTNWQNRVEHRGFIFHSTGGEYWSEGVSYHFTSKEIDLLEAAANEIHSLCTHAVDHIIRHDLFHKLFIPSKAIPLIKQSWERGDPYLYGRFDFAFDGISAPKLLEYNADTPTSLLESSVIQWDWLQDLYPDHDQFNSIHEVLIEKWQSLSISEMYFVCHSNNIEDYTTTEYLRDTAQQAGIQTHFLDISDVGYDPHSGHFCDLNSKKINTLFKLYPWEWMIQETFGDYVASAGAKFIEPIWKMLLGNKAILPILWEIAPNHPNLLPAATDNAALLSTDLVQKPIWGREGQNILLTHHQSKHQTDGIYNLTPTISQEYFPIPTFAEKYPVLGLWMVGDKCCGMSVRESDSPITNYTSQFVPHFFSD